MDYFMSKHRELRQVVTKSDKKNAWLLKQVRETAQIGNQNRYHGMRCDSCTNWESLCKSDLGEGAADANYCARLSRGFRLKPLTLIHPNQMELNAEINQRLKGEK